MKLRKTPAIATLKQFGLRTPHIFGHKEPNLVAQAMADKDYHPLAIRELAKNATLGQLFTTLVLRDTDRRDSQVIDYLSQVKLPDRISKTYKGTADENKAVDNALSSGIGNQPGNRIGAGAARNFSNSGTRLLGPVRRLETRRY